MFHISTDGMPKHRLVIFWKLTKISGHDYVSPQFSFVLLLFGHVNRYKLYKGCQEMWTGRNWDWLAKNTSGEQEIFILSFGDYQGIQVNYRITILDKTKTCENSALKNSIESICWSNIGHQISRGYTSQTISRKYILTFDCKSPFMGLIPYFTYFTLHYLPFSCI